MVLRTFFRPAFLLLLLGAVGMGACSGPSQSSDSSGPDATSADDRAAPVSVAEYETFDVAAYPVEPPEQTVEVTHQVPRRLMRGRADEGVKQTVEGFRIQVFSAQDQEAAQDFREKVRQWWAEAQPNAPSDLFQADPPIIIEYSQPYYRVRIGAFADRQEATDALEFINKQYPEAFVAQSTVTVVR